MKCLPFTALEFNDKKPYILISSKAFDAKEVVDGERLSDDELSCHCNIILVGTHNV
jgi:hypothetical protein